MQNVNSLEMKHYKSTKRERKRLNYCKYLNSFFTVSLAIGLTKRKNDVNSQLVVVKRVSRKHGILN